MVLTCRLSPPSLSTIAAMMHMYAAADGGNVVCHYVSISATSLTVHIKGKSNINNNNPSRMRQCPFICLDILPI